MTDPFVRDDLLEAVLRSRAGEAAPPELRTSILAAVAADGPRVVTRRGRASGHPWRLLAVAAVLLGTVGTAWYVGASRQTAVTPTPGPSLLAVVPIATASPPSAPPIATASPPSAPPTGLVAYPVVDCSTRWVTECVTTPWLSSADGRDAHVIQGMSVVGWSADGSKLLLEKISDVGGAVSLLAADPTGAVIATIEVPCTSPTIDEKYGGHLCPDQGEFALSPDGTRAAFTRTDPNVNDSSVVSVLDLATGQATILTATRTTNPPAIEVCNTSTKTRTCQGFDGSPRWSPNGRSIAFERQLMAPEPGASWDSAALFVVDADGSNLRRLTPRNVHAIDPTWSPDGTRLAFAGTDMVVNADGTSVLDIKSDIYRISLDGSGLARLTHDGVSSLPNWTSAGRLAFIRRAAPTGSEHWIMDADGRNQSRLGASLADLTAAGCTTCVYVAHEPVSGQLPRAFWQPVP